MKKDKNRGTGKKSIMLLLLLLAAGLVFTGCGPEDKVTIQGAAEQEGETVSVQEQPETADTDPSPEAEREEKAQNAVAIAKPTPDEKEKADTQKKEEAKKEKEAAAKPRESEREKTAEPYKASSVQKAYDAKALEAESVQNTAPDNATDTEAKDGDTKPQQDDAAIKEDEQTKPSANDKAKNEKSDDGTKEEPAASSSTGEPDETDSGEEQGETDQTAAEAGGVIVLDPGHSAVQKGNDVPLGPGSAETKAGDAVGTSGAASGLYEYQLTLQIARQLRTELEARGYTVYLTREDNDTAINCDERAEVANQIGADCFLRIHADGSEDPAASGAMAICITASNPWTADTYAESRRLSDSILSAYCGATGFGNRGVLEEDTMTGNNWAAVPTALLEMGFMTNPDEDLQMADPTFQSTMIQGIADGIDNWFAGR